MEHIIQINQLMTESEKIVFGYVGRSLETGKIKYYYLEKGDNPNCLHEFDINHICNDYLSSCLADCHFERPQFSHLLPQELEQALPSIINKHRAYNQENGYPTTSIDKNKIGLSVQPLIISGFCRTRPSAALYNSLDNIITIRTTKKEWEILSEEEKEKKKNHLIHEVGHLKVTKLFLTGNILNLQTGFDTTLYDTSSIELENGDIFYRIEKKKEKDIIQTNIEYILEEIMNDYDCYQAFPSFHRNYPRFGEQLNNLCDKELLKARNTNEIDEYFDRMYSIIPSKDLAIELLETIHAATYGTSREATTENAKKIVKRYEDAKRKR